MLSAELKTSQKKYNRPNQRAIDWETSQVPVEDDLRTPATVVNSTGRVSGVLGKLNGSSPKKGTGHVDAVVDAVCAGLRTYRSRGGKNLH